MGVRGGWHIGYDGYGILGTSGYDYYHLDNMDRVVKGHKQCKYPYRDLARTRPTCLLDR